MIGQRIQHEVSPQQEIEIGRRYKFRVIAKLPGVSDRGHLGIESDASPQVGDCQTRRSRRIDDDGRNDFQIPLQRAQFRQTEEYLETAVSGHLNAPAYRPPQNAIRDRRREIIIRNNAARGIHFQHTQQQPCRYLGTGNLTAHKNSDRTEIDNREHPLRKQPHIDHRILNRTCQRQPRTTDSGGVNRRTEPDIKIQGTVFQVVPLHLEQEIGQRRPVRPANLFRTFRQNNGYPEVFSGKRSAVSPHPEIMRLTGERGDRQRHRQRTDHDHFLGAHRTEIEHRIGGVHFQKFSQPSLQAGYSR